MTESLRLMAVLAHPDDETLGNGGTMARYSREEGVETYLVTATRGEAGRHGEGSEHPGPEALARIREEELRRAAEVLGIREVRILGYPDGGLDGVDPDHAVEKIVAELRRVRPQVVLTFDPFGAYGHPDHVAICQLTTAAVTAAADPGYRPPDPGAARASEEEAKGLPGTLGNGGPHRVSKLYYMAFSSATWAGYQAAFKTLVSRVGEEERQAVAWPDWAITTEIEAAEHWPTVWRAVQCHESQIAVYRTLGDLTEEHHRALWGSHQYYRAFSLVNGGRSREHDLFEGLR